MPISTEEHRRSSGDPGPTAYVSTGRLPPPDSVRAWVTAAYERYRSDRAGECSRVYPALGRVPADLFGVCVADTAGALYAAGDAQREPTIMSVSKPFVFALVCAAVGAEELRDWVGVDATGLPF